ncbi:MAG: ferredoxin family protein, partial [Planctomycetales bacterium]|nr:ferredoxin family protein [Planctomycetales bacterium]
MAKRITVVISQSQSKNPAKRNLEEEIVAGLLGERGVDVTVIPHLYDLAPEGSGMLCLQGITGDMIVGSWLFPRAARWILDRNQVHGREGVSLLKSPGESEEDEEELAAAQAADDDKLRVIDQRPAPNRAIYCLDLRTHAKAEPYLEEIRRIAREATTDVVGLTDWIGGAPKPEQMERYLNPAGNGNGNGNGAGQPAGPIKAAEGEGQTAHIVEEEPARRWYPVIDFSRCTNCMECIDFCLFGVYGLDKAETILVEQPDNCRKGCPACSRVCPENAIIFPQHKTPTIAGSNEAAGSLKIDLSKLFGAPDPGAPGEAG